MSDSEPDTKPVREKKKATPGQLAGLKKGMEILKAKREALAVQRDEHAKKQAAGEIAPEVPPPKLVAKPKVKKVAAPPPEPVLVIEERKRRSPNKPKTMSDDLKNELASLKAELSAMKKPAEIKIEEKIVEKPVEVVRERVVTGSALLDAVFKFK